MTTLVIHLTAFALFGWLYFATVRFYLRKWHECERGSQEQDPPGIA
jgi:hypothetical protein